MGQSHPSGFIFPRGQPPQPGRRCFEKTHQSVRKRRRQSQQKLEWRRSSRERWRGERELPAEEEHQSVEDIGTGTSPASHRQGRVQHLLTGTSCGSHLLHFLLPRPLTMAVTSLWESLESLHYAVIGQKPDL